MSREVIKEEIKSLIGSEPDNDSIDTIYWFKTNNPTYDLDTMINDYYGR